MKVPRPFLTKLSLATVVAASAGLGWATPATMAGILPNAPVIIFQSAGQGGIVSFHLTPNPSVFSFVQSAGPGVESVANIEAQYEFVVHGPAPADLDIELFAQYSFAGLITGRPNPLDDTSWAAIVDVDLNHHRILLGSGSSASGGSPPQHSFFDSIGIDAVPPDTIQIISLITSAGWTDGRVKSHGAGFAIADPVITFAPGFDSTGYSLEFSPGVGNEPDSGPGTATPEPSTLVLSSILFGMWGVVWAYRQWKRFVSTGLRNGTCAALLVLAMILGSAGAANAGTVWHVGDLTTYNQAIWGGVPGTDAGATLLVADFDTVYASTGGVIVGSPSRFTMIFTDVTSVLAYLPSIGPYAPLNGSVLNPISTVSGAFGGDVLALAFNVGFSDAGFLPETSGLHFGDLVLTDFSTLPQLNGLTVRQLLGDVNILLSGGSSIVSISDLGTLVTDLDASFNNGIPSQFAQDHLEAPSGPAVPEPSSWVIWGSGLLGLAAIRRWKRRH